MFIGQLQISKDTLKEKEVHWKIPAVLMLDISKMVVAPVFKFLHANCRISIDPSEDRNPGSFTVEFHATEMNSSYEVVCTFGIRNAFGQMIGIRSFKHTFSSQEVTLIVHKFFTRDALSQRSSELMPLNDLTIICNLKHGADDPTKLTELNTLSENIKGLFTSGEHCDTTLQLENREFKAHRIILAARSPVFAAMFKHETSEKQTGIVNIPDCDPDSFQEFLEFLYCGKLENTSFRNTLHLYKTADKYDVLELKKFCVEYMEHNLKVENVCNVISLADEYDETDLLSEAQAFFNQNLSGIFETAEWETLFKENFSLANKLLKQMATKVNVVECLFPKSFLKNMC